MDARRERLIDFFKRMTRRIAAASRGFVVVSGYEDVDREIAELVAERSGVSVESLNRCELTAEDWERLDAAAWVLGKELAEEEDEPPPSGRWRRARGLCAEHPVGDDDEPPRSGPRLSDSGRLLL